MGDNLEDDEFTIEEAIELELHAINCVLSAVQGTPLHFQIREKLATLLEQLRLGQVLAEYAEVQLDKLRAQWRGNHQMPPD